MEYGDALALNITSEANKSARRVVCRYGRGCTHIQDPIHKERFWHPTAPILTEEIVRTHYICNECGAPFRELSELQLHLKRKTAWSNASLVGCRISCLVDYKEWHEGSVTQFHKSGKHFVEFRHIGEKRWLNMKKLSFYIVERPHPVLKEGEHKDDDIGYAEGILAPVESSWIFVEEISPDYAYAQSVLFKIYGEAVQETGHKTRGHICLTDLDRDNGKNGKGSLLYGELLPRGSNKAFGRKRLAVEFASVLFDLGMGTAKILIQAFLQFRNLKYVYGIELSAGRYALAEEAAMRMIQILGPDNFRYEILPGKYIIVTELPVKQKQNATTTSAPAGGSQVHHEDEGEDEEYYYSGRVLHLEFGDMFSVCNIGIADVVMLETDIPADLQPQLCDLLSGMAEGARTLTYLDLRKIWGPNLALTSSPVATVLSDQFPFKQLECNKHLSDRFPTSWSVQRGHHFFLWVKTFKSNFTEGLSTADSMLFKTQKLSNHSTKSSSSSHGGETNDSDSDNSSTSGCLPFSLLFFSFRKSKGAKSKANKDREDERRTVIPLNSDGSRANTNKAKSKQVIQQSNNSSSTHLHQPNQQHQPLEYIPETVKLIRESIINSKANSQLRNAHTQLHVHHMSPHDDDSTDSLSSVEAGRLHINKKSPRASSVAGRSTHTGSPDMDVDESIPSSAEMHFESSTSSSSNGAVLVDKGTCNYPNTSSFITSPNSRSFLASPDYIDGNVQQPVYLETYFNTRPTLSSPPNNIALSKNRKVESEDDLSSLAQAPPAAATAGASPNHSLSLVNPNNQRLLSSTSFDSPTKSSRTWEDSESMHTPSALKDPITTNNNSHATNLPKPKTLFIESSISECADDDVLQLTKQSLASFPKCANQPPLNDSPNHNDNENSDEFDDHISPKLLHLGNNNTQTKRPKSAKEKSCVIS